MNFVGYCDLASLKKVHPENKKLRPENTGQPKSARAGKWKMKISQFSIGLDNRKALALYGCTVFSGHNFIYYF